MTAPVFKSEAERLTHNLEKTRREIKQHEKALAKAKQEVTQGLSTGRAARQIERQLNKLRAAELALLDHPKNTAKPPRAAKGPSQVQSVHAKRVETHGEETAAKRAIQEGRRNKASAKQGLPAAQDLSAVATSLLSLAPVPDVVDTTARIQKYPRGSKPSPHPNA